MSPWSAPPRDRARPKAGTLADAIRLLAGRRFAVLTGAGLSTDSGIPDYRGPDSPQRRPMTYQQFAGDPDFRRTYWARSFVGWRLARRARPNAGHVALARMERRGLTTGIVTQNVDLLHEQAGARHVVDLHGRSDRVVCLRCGATCSRAEMDRRLELANPGFLQRLGDLRGVEVAPDADAVVPYTRDFRVPACPAPAPGGLGRCGGVLKPDIVYVGESVPPARLAAAYAVIDRAAALLVAGSTLAVYSGLRLARRAAGRGEPVVILNRGATRGDPLASLTLEAGTSESLSRLARDLPDVHSVP